MFPPQTEVTQNGESRTASGALKSTRNQHALTDAWARLREGCKGKSTTYPMPAACSSFDRFGVVSLSSFPNSRSPVASAQCLFGAVTMYIAL